MCKLCTSSATISAAAIGRIVMFELPILIMAVVIIRAIMVLDRASASALVDIILTEATVSAAMSLAATAGATGSEATAEVMDLEATAAATTGETSLQPVLLS